MNTIETRLIALENENRRYRRLLFSLVGIIGLTAIFAFTRTKAVPETLQAKNFEVVNDQSKVLVRLTTLDGSGRVSTFNPSGQKQVDLIPNNAGGGSLLVYDGKGNLNARITYTEGGGGSLGVYNGTGKQVIRLGNNTAGGGDIYIRGSKGDDRVRVTTTEDDAGSLSVFNNTNARILHFSAANNQSGVINVYNAATTRINSLGADSEDNGGLDCWNKGGTKTATIPSN